VAQAGSRHCALQDADRFTGAPSARRLRGHPWEVAARTSLGNGAAVIDNPLLHAGTSAAPYPPLASTSRTPQPPPRTAPTSRNSITPSRAFLTSGVSVLIFMPGPAGMAQDATGLGLFSTWEEGQARDAPAPPKSEHGSMAVSCAAGSSARMEGHLCGLLAMAGKGTASQLRRSRVAPASRRSCSPPPDTCGSCRQPRAAGGSRTCGIHRGQQGSRRFSPGCGHPRLSCLPASQSKAALLRLSRSPRCTHLGMSMPAASQACSTLQPLGI
jgi:hypothetical protein